MAWWLSILCGAGLLFVLLLWRRQARDLRARLREREEALFHARRNLADAKLRGLRMQLDPHFLFNTLNGLAVLIDKGDNARARKMLDELSGFLRRTLRKQREKWISLEQELDYARQYLRIEQYRFGARLTCFEDCEPLALTAKVPPMLLQPLLENAIVHGLADKEGECRLNLECRLYDRYLLIMIFDNGDGFDPAPDGSSKDGIGLANVRERLQEAYGTHYSLRIEKQPGGTLVSLKLPAYKDSQF